jgi:hypothetical protein
MLGLLALVLPSDRPLLRNEGVTDTHTYAPNGIINHGLLTLSAITAQPFVSLW